MAGSYFYKKIISIVLLMAVLVVGIFPQTALAAHDDVTPADMAAAVRPPSSTSTNPATQPGQSSTEQSGDIECVGSSWGMPTLDIMGCMALGAYAILGWVSWILWLSAILFNYAIPYTLNMATFIKDVPMVALGWTTFRDLSNLFFIFIVLYIAISTIVGNEGYGIKKLLSKVIIGAVLINFSLFFTQAMIDVSNVFALQFYNKITQTGAAQAKVATSGTDKSSSFIAATTPTGGKDDLSGGISAIFVNALGLHEIWSIGSTQANTTGAQGLDPNKKENSGLALNSRNLLIAALGGIVLVLMTSFVFFAAIIMFLARAVVLIFLMILSPLAFLGNVLPAVGKYTGEWWGKLFSNLLFAPTYMALLYLVINIIAGGQFKGVGAAGGGGSGSFIGIFAGDDNMIGAAMTFFILNALMVGCLLVAGKMGVIGGKWAEKTGVDLAKSLGMKVSGANLALNTARGGLGVVGSGLENSKILSRMASSRLPLGGLGLAAGSLMSGGKKMQKLKVGGESFDDRVKAQADVYSERAGMIRKAIGGEAGIKAEKRYLKSNDKGEFTGWALTRTGLAAAKKSAKKGGKSSQEDDLKHLLADGKGIPGKKGYGKYSEANATAAEVRIETIDTDVKRLRAEMGNAATTGARKQQIKDELSVLKDEKSELKDVVSGYERSISKLKEIQAK